MSVEPYRIRTPATAAVPLVVSIPHAGTWLPPEVAEALASPQMAALPDTDWHLHELYDFLPTLGATTLYATVSRFVVDLNRPPEPRPLYPGRLETGLVPLQTFRGEPVFRSAPTAAEIEARRQSWHAPYHGRLKTLLDEMREQFGRVVLVDAHSIASGPSLLQGPLEEEIYLGDRDGETCGAWLRTLLLEAFRAEGCSVAMNSPFKGGYITDHYGRLAGVEAIQIEMAQRVYMEEGSPESATEQPRFAAARAMLRRVVGGLAARLRGGVPDTG